MDSPEVMLGIESGSECLTEPAEVLPGPEDDLGLLMDPLKISLDVQEDSESLWDSPKDSLDLEEGIGRLLNLTKFLNLEDCDKSSNPVCQQYPFVDDFLKLREHIGQQKKIVCIYGLDSPLFDDLLFKKMQVLACQLVFHSCSAIAYCNLRSSLFVEVIEFFDEVFAEVEIRLMSSTDDNEIERIVKFADKLRKIYSIYM